MNMINNENIGIMMKITKMVAGEWSENGRNRAEQLTQNGRKHTKFRLFDGYRIAAMF